MSSAGGKKLVQALHVHHGPADRAVGAMKRADADAVLPGVKGAAAAEMELIPDS